MTTLATIGSGHIGSQLARLAVAHGYTVVVSNSRGPETLAALVEELGPSARAATKQDAAASGDIVVVSTPLSAIDGLPVAELAGKTVIDTNNYYPQRDGTIAELEDGSLTVSGMLQRALPDSHVVKAFNHIRSDHLTSEASASGTPGRRALAIYGDDEHARTQVAALIDLFGFDTVDGGPLEDSWRIQAGTPGYGSVDTAAELEEHLADAVR